MTTDERLAHLEFQMGLLIHAVDMEDRPFDGLILESNLTEVQRRQILDLMNEADKSIESGKPMGHHEFERRVYAIDPKHDGDYSFAENIVSCLNREQRYQRVFKHMRQDGMNIHD